MKQSLIEVTEKIRERSAPTRQAYLQRVEQTLARPRGSDRMGCANVAHAFAAMPADDKLRIVAEKAPHIGIITAYNDMLSAHQPYEVFPRSFAMKRIKTVPPYRSPAACRPCATA